MATDNIAIALHYLPCSINIHTFLHWVTCLYALARACARAFTHSNITIFEKSHSVVEMRTLPMTLKLMMIFFFLNILRAFNFHFAFHTISSATVFVKLMLLFICVVHRIGIIENCNATRHRQCTPKIVQSVARLSTISSFFFSKCIETISTSNLIIEWHSDGIVYQRYT